MPKEKIIVKREHKPLHCPICGVRFMNLFGQPLPNHSQIRCKTVEGNEMDLGICAECVNGGVTMEMCTAVLEGIKDFWIYDIDINKNMSPEEKTKRKNFHKSHELSEIIRFIPTGERAEKQARKMGKLK
jgi:hypothetical protein